MQNYFSDKELQCKCCGKLVLAPGFRDDINALRDAAGHEMQINSACRCPIHNKNVGGRPSSFHLTTIAGIGTCAADISITGWGTAKVWRFVKIAMGMGFSIGIARTFIHIDRRARYPETGWSEPAFFTY